MIANQPKDDAESPRYYCLARVALFAEGSSDVLGHPSMHSVQALVCLLSSLISISFINHLLTGLDESLRFIDGTISRRFDWQSVYSVRYCD